MWGAGQNGVRFPTLDATAQPVDEEWRYRAACGDTDPETFFPIGEGQKALTHVAAAKAVCARCPVVDECLDFALTTGQEFGVWGGLSEQERRALRRRSARGTS